MSLVPILAAIGEVTSVEDLNVGRNSITGRLQTTDILLIIAVALLLLTALVCWAIFIRKPASETRSRVHKSHPQVEETEDGMIRKRKKHRRQRREHRQRNPTLNEAGGLPPVRPNSNTPPI